MFRNISIKRKQVFISLLCSGVALLITCAAYTTYDAITFRKSRVQSLASLAGIIGASSIAALEFEDRDTAQELLQGLANEEHILAACIYDDQARIFVRFTSGPLEEELPARPIAEDRHEFGEQYLHLFRRIVSKGELIGVIYIRGDLSGIHRRLAQYLGIGAAVLLGATFVSFLLSIRLQRVISEPLLNLSKAAMTVSTQRDYSLRVPCHGRDELGYLILVFNEMLAQIQERDAALQAAHDGLGKRVAERTQELELEVAERRKAEEGLHQQLARISLLNSITRAITDRQDLESIVHVVLRQLEDQLPIDFGRVYLFDPATQAITLATHRSARPASGSETALDVFVKDLSLAETGFAACSHGEMVYLPDTAGSPASIPARLARSQLASAVAVPLMVESELFGILLAARRQEDAFSSGECEFLRMLGEAVALAAHQAKLYSQLQNAYDELRQTQQAVMQEDRLRALGQMASGIAHDINNALSPITVYSELLLDTESLRPPARNKLENIRTAGQDIACIVARMREFYRRRDENDPLVLVNLNKMVEQTLELTRPRWRDIPQARGIVVEMETDLEPGLPDVLGNESELREALTNLILNSVDAVPGGGKLTLSTRLRGWDHCAHGEHRQAILEVRDNGVGMDEQTRKRCLEPFFSTKGKRGTGLGLAMVYGIMERHEGAIEVESDRNQGTAMRLIFPVREHPPQADAVKPRLATPLPSLRVLCVDDEPLLRDMLKQLLESGGHSVEVADGGQAGLETFRAARRRGEPFDVVITDLGMPYLDGNQLAKTLKRESARTPIIMLTGWGTIMKEDGELPAQVDAVISKPPKIHELYEMLGKVTSAEAGT